MLLQTHAMPYRLTGESAEILLVTSRRRRKWILPKGKIEKGETASQRAAIEAFEEAGVRGRVSTKPLRLSSLPDPSRAPVYPLLVLEQLDDWPEKAVRQRAWFSLSETRSRLRDESLQQAVTAFAAGISADRLAAQRDD